MTEVPDWARQARSLLARDGTLWVRSEPSASGLIGWYRDGVGIAKPWEIVSRYAPLVEPGICNECWFHNCKDCTGKTSSYDGPCDHLRTGHYEEQP